MICKKFLIISGMIWSCEFAAPKNQSNQSQEGSRWRATMKPSLPWVLCSSSFFFGKVTLWSQLSIWLGIKNPWISCSYDQAAVKSRQVTRIVTSPNNKRWVSRADPYQHTLLFTEDSQRLNRWCSVETVNEAQRQYGPGKELVDLSRSRCLGCCLLPGLRSCYPKRREMSPTSLPANFRISELWRYDIL